jgi:hypothetical protein
VPEDYSFLDALAVVVLVSVAVILILTGLRALVGRGRGGNDKPPGVRDVLVVAGGAVALVLAAAGATALLPKDGQAVVFHTPLLIAVLVGGTAFVLWRILRSPRT